MHRKICALMMPLILTLAACGGGGQEREAEKALLELRGKYLEMISCSGHLDLTADYGRRVYTYGIDFTWAKEGETVLTITAPTNVVGTSAHIAAGETTLEYDGVMVETGPVDSSGLSPIDALPAFLAYIREGFVAECVLEAQDGIQRLHVVCRDPEKEPGKGIECDLWFQPDTGTLLRGELSEEGYTVIYSDVTEFTMELPSEE